MAPGLATAQAVEPPPLRAYGALPSLELVELSPSGDRVAFIGVSGEQRRLVLVDLKAGTSLSNVDIGAIKMRGLRWIGEDRVLVISTQTAAARHLGIDDSEMTAGQIFDVGSGRVTQMLANMRGTLPVLMSRVYVSTAQGDPQLLVRAFSTQHPERVDLYRVDPETGRGRLAEIMFPDVDDFVFDPMADRTSARGEYNSRSGEWTLRVRSDGGAYRQVWRTNAPIDVPSLVGLGPGGDSVIVAADRPDLDDAGSKSTRVFDVRLSSGEWRPLDFEFEPDSLVFHPLTGRLIGAERIDDDRRSYLFTDTDADRLWKHAEGVLADKSPTIVSWSDDLRQAILFTSGAGDSGTYYLLDLDSVALNEIGSAYPDIAPESVGSIRSFSYNAADGLEIPGYLTLPPGESGARNLPLVVLVHGGPASHDTLSFDWWAQAIASRGYAVLQPNFRGSTGYGDDFMEAGYAEWGRKMQTDLSDGVRRLAADGVIDPARVCIMGASYGGYAAMAGPTLDPGVYRCAVSVNGVSDLRRMVNDEARVREHRDNETVRYWNRFMGAERLGDRSLDARSPAKVAAQADAPMLLIHGRDDTVVPIEQSRVMAQALRIAGKPVEIVELDGEDHWLSRSDTRLRMLNETIAFLDRYNPPN
ncbi:alpha/beta hydrolase family protein [Brevundimonas lutea]|uniref:alpha/beta hydrolase family protein n=1 Tax=Brevundimonas lutea TaxID=2293980 RepID=UPI000F016525|nr:S9 family peptidase [Brevundimonas lutea]